MRQSLCGIVLLAGVLWPASGAAQIQGTAVGIRAGLNRANVSSTQFGFGVESRYALAGGAFISFTQSGRLTIQPEVLFSPKGFSALVTGGTADVNLDYLEIPLLFKIRVGEQNRRIRPTLILGSFVGFEVGCSLSGELEGLGGETDCDAVLAGRGEMDAGIVLGGGVDYGLVGRYFLTGDLRYAHGLLNLDWEGEEDRVATRVWTLMLGFGVLLGR